MKYLKIQELSSHLNVKVKTIYSWISLKEISHLKLGRLVRFDKNEIDQWLAQKKFTRSTMRKEVQISESERYNQCHPVRKSGPLKGGEFNGPF